MWFQLLILILAAKIAGESVILIDLVYNLSVLVAFSVLSGFIEARYQRSRLNGKILQGILFGLTSIIGMLNPFVLTAGIIFDGRSIVISLCTLFFGPISGAIATIMSIIYRLYIGGPGSIMGILVIFTSFLFGLFFHQWKLNNPDRKFTKSRMYVLGLLVHSAMLIYVLALPAQNIFETYKLISLTVIGIYPIVTLLIGKVLMDQEENQLFIDKLKESDLRLRLASEGAELGIWAQDFKTGKIYRTGKWAEMLGYRPEEITPEVSAWINMVHPEDYPRSINAIKEHESGVTSEYRVEHRLQCKSGEYKWILNWGRISERDENGKPVRGYGIHLDIDKLKRAEQALKESEERYKNIFRNNHAAMLLIDPTSGKIIDANPAAAYFYGWSTDELKQMNVADINTLSPEQIKKEMRRAVSQNQNSSEFCHRISDGSIRNVEVNSGTIKIKNIEYLFSIIHDITQKKKAEEELIKLNRAVEQSSMSILITDNTGNIEYVNPYFTEILGFTLEEVRNRNPRILKSGYQSNNFYANLWNTILAGKNWKGELLNKKKNGELVWENAVISPIVNNKGKITHFVSIREDITEKKRMLQEIIEAKEKAETSDKLKSEFLAQISHEIRSPINTMINFSSLLEMELKEIKNEDFDISFAGIKSAGSRIVRTIDLILNMSELQLGTYEPTRREIDLRVIITNLIKEYEKLAEVKNLRINYFENCTRWRVNTDDYAVTQIIANLMDNALKYTKKGEVSIHLIDDTDNSLLVVVKDTGIGISEEYLGSMFIPFTQEEHGYTRRFEGNGLGLALIKRYCDLLSLEINVESKKGSGTAITLKFPAAQLIQ